MPATEQEKIFARISEALTSPAHGPAGGLPTLIEHRRVMPLVGATIEEQLALFRVNADDLRADFQLVASRDELDSKLRALRDAGGWKIAAAHNGELSGRMAEVLGLPVLTTDGGYDKNELAVCDVGITECDALVAQTGSVVVTSRSAGGRALSCLPPHHIVLARREQLVPDLPAAFELLQKKYGASYPSMISFITGPSRTGDIERILVLGAHGPKKLTIFAV
jgi:L-lactate dehydrogenase complex protein LldG